MYLGCLRVEENPKQPAPGAVRDECFDCKCAIWKREGDQITFDVELYASHEIRPVCLPCASKRGMDVEAALKAGIANAMRRVGTWNRLN